MNLQKIAALVGLALALVAAFVMVPYVGLILAVLGLVVGYTIVAEEHVRVIVSALALKYVADTFDTIPAPVGGYVTSIIGSIAVIAAGAALMIIFRNIYARVKP